jgi:predicted porin
MKVRLVVFAGAFAFASAFPAWGQGFQVGSATNVSISGLLAVGLKQSEVTNTARPGMTGETRLDDNTSRLIISSTSKIAEGWNVIFRLESRYQADVRPIDPAIPGTTIYSGNITGFADGDTWGGVSSPYGSLMFGKSTVYYTDTIDVSYLGLPSSAGEGYRIWDANGLGTFNLLDQVNPQTKTGVGAASSFTLGNTRSRNVVRFNSVKFSGFDFSLAWSKNPDGDELHYVAPAADGSTPGYARNYENGRMLYGSVRYNNGPLAASLSYLDKRVMGGVYNPAVAAGPADVQATRLGIAYTLPFKMKVGVVYDHTSIDNAVYSTPTSSVASEAAKRDVFLVPVSFSWKNHAFYATYGWAGNTSSHADTGATQLNLGYDYALTKRAFVGIYYTLLTNGKNGHYTPFLSGYSLGPTTNSVVGEDWHQVGINLNYWF